MTVRDDPRGLTLRSIATGMVIGTVLTPCNVYSGLKIGWSFNMSITSALIAFAFWRLAGDLLGARPWGMQENVMNQTTASSAASIISAGLVAPIPALTLLTGQKLAWPRWQSRRSLDSHQQQRQLASCDEHARSGPAIGPRPCLRCRR